MSTTHELKSWPDFFEPLASGSKKFEVRFNDRHFHVGDTLYIREFDDRTGKYTGRSLRKRVTYILDGVGQGGIAPLAGVHPRHVVMSLDDEVAA
jgi:hypothetical protein